MTFNPLKTGVLAAFAIAALGVATFVSPVSAMADETAVQTVETPTDFQVTSASNGLIRSGIKAYKKGDFAKSVALNKAVIRIRPNRRKTAVAQSNLCASWAKLGDYVQAETACDAALEINPELEVAKSNRELLRIQLAQK